MILPEVRSYLDEVKEHLHLAPVTEKQLIIELYSHFQERVAELQRRGVPEKEAARAAIKFFGRARVVARLLYEACSKGSWTDAVITLLPHLIIVGLFAYHLWRHPLLAPVALTLIVGVTLFGWWRGKPNWLYSWVGYSLVPLLVIGYGSYFVVEQAASFLFWGEGSLPSLWLLALVLAFYAFSLWLIVWATIRVVRRDWVLASLMLLPLPVIGCWLFNMQQVGGLFQSDRAVLHQWDIPMVLALVMLGITSAVFIRLRQRVLKAGAVITFGSVALVMVAHNLWGDLGFFGLIAFALVMLIFLFLPALLEVIVGHGEDEIEVWWQNEREEHPSPVS